MNYISQLERKRLATRRDLSLKIGPTFLHFQSSLKQAVDTMHNNYIKNTNHLTSAEQNKSTAQ